MPTPATPTTDFIRLENEQSRKDFYARLKGPKWWTMGGKKSPDHGWIEVFQLSDWKCVYCDRDLAASSDALAESTEEHLVPRSLLEPNGENPTVEHNMAACCPSCNALKAEYVPVASDRCWQTRKAYVKACARFIASRRLENFRKYQKHIEAALKRRAGE